MSERRRKPSRVGEVLSTVLENTGLAARIDQMSVLERWPTLVGPQIAAATEARTVTADGTLFVGVRNHAWMSELSLLEPEILKAINDSPDRPPVRQIRWKLMSRNTP